MTHHPHLHMIVPGGGLSLDGKKWLACRPGFFLPVRVLSRLFLKSSLTRTPRAARVLRRHTALANAAAFAIRFCPGPSQFIVVSASAGLR